MRSFMSLKPKVPNRIIYACICELCHLPLSMRRIHHPSHMGSSKHFSVRLISEMW